MVSLNQPSQGDKDWHTPLNENLGKIASALNHYERVANAFAPHEQDTPNMTIRVEAGYMAEGGVLSEIAAQTSNAFGPPGSADRIDRVVSSATDGSISIITGTENSSPSPPGIPAGNFPLAQVYLTPTTSEITNSEITDERAGNTLGSTIEEIIRTQSGSGAGPATTLTGEIKMYAAAGEPAGWLQCNGKEVSRVTYSDLYNTIGATYGAGDGSTTFNLPDLRDRFPLGENSLGSGDASRVDNFVTNLGREGGDAEHTLSRSEMPSHSHTFKEARNTGSNQALGFDGGNDDSYAHSRKTSIEGGDAAHNNMPPFQTFNFIIKT